MAPFFRNGGRQVVPPSLIDHLYYSNSPAPLPNLDSNTIRLSDEAIARQLTVEGIEIARRTVAKYREAENIAPKSLRRRLKSKE